jgi:hypothetical protein
VLGAVFLQGGQWFLPGPQWQALVSAGGVLLVLWVIPGGLGDVVYRVRDAGLRYIANRRGLVVPSLIADVRQDDEVLEAAEHSVEQREATIAATAATAPEPAASVNGDQPSEPAVPSEPPGVPAASPGAPS